MRLLNSRLMANPHNNSQDSLEEVKNKKDIKNTQQQERGWYNLKVMDTRIILAALGGVMVASGFLLDLDVRVRVVSIVLGTFLIYKGRYY